MTDGSSKNGAAQADLAGTLATAGAVLAFLALKKLDNHLEGRLRSPACDVRTPPPTLPQPVGRRVLPLRAKPLTPLIEMRSVRKGLAAMMPPSAEENEIDIEVNRSS